MWARATRVEFIIVAVALLVLLLCGNPPKSGKASIDDITSPGSTQPADPILPDPDLPAPDAEDSEEVPTLDQGDEDDPNGVLLEEAAAQVPTPRVAAVDARNCDGLDYQNVMYGQVTVRWVWNGTKFVPQKVCVVEEEDGTSSVWSFDQQDDVVLSEVGAPSNPSH